ncbi:trace amine-associated receptor 13c-like [Amia ocellicauda]|uniref:trace amine-associated receptor 13c-like n=1 Tax=Amia ocellicauda TaxID=2972642 RepID=UPI003463FF8E
MYISAAAVVMLTVCGNLMVIISISHFKQLHTPTNLLLLSLAVADLLVGVTVMPFSLIVLIETCWYFGDTFCLIYNTLGYGLCSVSVFNVACIAIDRYFAVCDPLLYSTKITLNITWSVILLNWLLSHIYSLTLIYFGGNIGTQDMNNCVGNCLLIVNESWRIIDLVLAFVLPCSAMIILYVNIFIVARKHRKEISTTEQVRSTNQTKSTVPKKSKRKAATTLGITVGVFLLCLVPWYIYTLIDDSLNISSSFANNFLSWLFYLNSSINPIIYAFFYPWFQKSVKLIVTLRICHPASSLINLFQEKL